MADPTVGGGTEGLPKCSKPGCGALRLIGQPCTDWDCPQQWVSAAEHRSALARAPAEQARVEAELDDYRQAASVEASERRRLTAERDRLKAEITLLKKHIGALRDALDRSEARYAEAQNGPNG